MPDYGLNVVKTLDYMRPEMDKGYTDQTLSVNISNQDVLIQPVEPKIKDVFIGGKGYDLWLLWNAVESTTRWDDPINAICIASGPLGGTPIYPGSGKSIVTTLSPLTGSVIDSNVGGYFGPYLKFSGFDALQIQGKSSKDTIVYINGIDGQVVQRPAEPGDKTHEQEQQAVVDDYDHGHSRKGKDHAFGGAVEPMQHYDQQESQPAKQQDLAGSARG